MIIFFSIKCGRMNEKSSQSEFCILFVAFCRLKAIILTVLQDSRNRVKQMFSRRRRYNFFQPSLTEKVRNPFRIQGQQVDVLRRWSTQRSFMRSELRPDQASERVYLFRIPSVDKWYPFPGHCTWFRTLLLPF